MKNFLLLVCFAFISIAVSGCSTVDGMGKDLSKASQTVKEKL